MNEIELLFVEPLGYDVHGLPAVKVDGAEYIVAETDDQAQRAAIEAARDSLWAFNTEFIGGFLGWDTRTIDAIKKVQAELCEDAQPVIEQMLGDKVDEFLSDAVDADGRGHFLSPYDGEEQDGEDVSPALEGKIVYRTN